MLINEGDEQNVPTITNKSDLEESKEGDECNLSQEKEETLKIASIPITKAKNISAPITSPLNVKLRNRITEVSQEHLLSSGLKCRSSNADDDSYSTDEVNDGVDDTYDIQL